MTPRHKSFTTSAQPEREPVTFDIDNETFTCRSSLPGGVLFDYAGKLAGLLEIAEEIRGGGSITAESAPKAAMSIQAVMEFLQETMEPSEYERFRAYVRAPNTRVEDTLLLEITAYLVEQYAVFPTSTPSPSPSGPPSDGPTSTEPVPAPA